MAWTQGRPADQGDAETARILAGYPPELFRPSALDELLGKWNEEAAAETRRGLELLARARIETVPDDFRSRDLMATIRDWQGDLGEWEIGPEPPAAERDALRAVDSAAHRLTLALDRLAEQMSQRASRIAGSTFTRDWYDVRLNRLRRELADLCSAASSPEVADTMRREDRPLKPKGGWSARVAFFGDDLPALYRSIFKRPFTASGKANAEPSEGLRFACVIATEVLGHVVTPEVIVRQRTAYHAARGGKRRRK